MGNHQTDTIDTPLAPEQGLSNASVIADFLTVRTTYSFIYLLTYFLLIESREMPPADAARGYLSIVSEP